MAIVYVTFTRANLANHKIPLDTTCSLCLDIVETRDDLCNTTSYVWSLPPPLETERTPGGHFIMSLGGPFNHGILSLLWLYVLFGSATMTSALEGVGNTRGKSYPTFWVSLRLGRFSGCNHLVQTKLITEVHRNSSTSLLPDDVGYDATGDDEPS